jgi:hypothetical protein
LTLLVGLIPMYPPNALVVCYSFLDHILLKFAANARLWFGFFFFCDGIPLHSRGYLKPLVNFKFYYYTQRVWICTIGRDFVFFSLNSLFFLPEFFAVDTYTGRLRIHKISKGYGERKSWRISSRTVEVYDIFKVDHILAPEKGLGNPEKFERCSMWRLILSSASEFFSGMRVLLCGGKGLKCHKMSHHLFSERSFNMSRSPGSTPCPRLGKAIWSCRNYSTWYRMSLKFSSIF